MGVLYFYCTLYSFGQQLELKLGDIIQIVWPKPLALLALAYLYTVKAHFVSLFLVH